MQFGLSEEQSLLQESIKRFLTNQAPLDAVRKIADGESTDGDIWSGLVDLGIPSLLINEANGGLGLSSLDAAIVAETLGYHVTPSPFLSSAVIAPVVLQSAGQREDLLGSVATGETRIGIAFTEAIGARAEIKVASANGVLNGQSLFVLDTDADCYLVATAEQTIHLVQADASGLEKKNLSTVDRTRSTCALAYNNVPSELISEDPTIFHHALDTALVTMAADTLGTAQCALDQAVAYSGQREQFNRVIASFQAVKHMCAEMAAALEPCRSMVWYAAHTLDELPSEASMMASHTKAHLSEVGQFVTRTATEVHGGMGFTDLVGLHYWFKRAGFNRQIMGSPEWLRQRAFQFQNLISNDASRS